MADSKTRLLDLTDFEVEAVAFELRYTNAYLFWDYAGHIWTDLLKIFPNLEMSEAQPATTTFTLPPYTTFQIDMDKCLIVSRTSEYPLSDMIEFAGALVECVIRHLDLKVFSRAGLRITHAKIYPSLSEAIEALLSGGICRPPQGSVFGIGETHVRPEYIIRWEHENVGAIVRGKTEQRKFEFTPPPSFKDVERVQRDKNALVIDIDYFNTGPINVAQFRASDWIKSGVHLIRQEFIRFARASNG